MRIGRHAQQLEVVHCALHRVNLAAKILPKSLSKVISIVKRAVNLIKGSAFLTRELKRLCSEKNKVHAYLINITECRWLSFGRCLERFVELYEIVREILRGKPLFRCLRSLNTKTIIFYLADIFRYLNFLYYGLQGNCKDVVYSSTLIRKFITHFQTLKLQLLSNNLNLFPFLSSLNRQISARQISTFSNHLSQLSKALERRFTDLLAINVPPWVENPFCVIPEHFPSTIRDELVQLQASQQANDIFNLDGSRTMWISRGSDFPTLWKIVQPLYLQSPTTWAVEKAFSKVAHMMPKSRHSLLIASSGDLRLSLSNISPRIHQLVASHQPHVIHRPSADA